MVNAWSMVNLLMVNHGYSGFGKCPSDSGDFEHQFLLYLLEIIFSIVGRCSMVDKN